MSWLWQDKKTEQLKNILTKAEEEDRNNTVEKLSVVKKECLEFKEHLTDCLCKNLKILKPKIFRFCFDHFHGSIYFNLRHHE